MVSSQNRATFKSSSLSSFFPYVFYEHTVVVTCFANIIYTVYIYIYIHIYTVYTQHFQTHPEDVCSGVHTSWDRKTPKPGAPGDLTKSEQVTCWLRPRHPRLG